MSSSDPLNLAAFTPSDSVRSGLSKTQKRKKSRSNQGARSDDSVKVTPVKLMKSRSLVGISQVDVPRGQKSKLKHAPSRSYQQHKSGNASSSRSETSDAKSSHRLVYQSSAIGGSVNAAKDPRLHIDDIGKTAGLAFKKAASVGKVEPAQDLPYDPKIMASQCRRVVNFPSKLGQIAEVGRFIEQLSVKDPVHGKSSDVLCSSKITGMRRRKYRRMKDTWTEETSRVLNQTARVAAVVQARTISITFDVIKEYKEQVPDVFLMFKAGFNPEGWE